jgi:hypothetical protein
MSADNGIYIGKFPTDSGHEYRVIHAQAIENVDYGNIEMQNAYRFAYFGRKGVEVFADRGIALVYAYDWAKEFDILEYGVVEIEFDRPIVPMTDEKLKEILGY